MADCSLNSLAASGGFRIEGFLSGRTLLIKSLGLVLAVASGLSLGTLYLMPMLDNHQLRSVQSRQRGANGAHCQRALPKATAHELFGLFADQSTLWLCQCLGNMIASRCHVYRANEVCYFPHGMSM